MTSRSHPEPARQPPPAQHPPAQYEPYLDGLFTYCMSVLCDHDDAVAALGDVLAIAERQPRRRPATPAEWRPWLYSLARWACLRRMERKPAPRTAPRTSHRSTPKPPRRSVPKPALRPAAEKRSASAEEKRSASGTEKRSASGTEPAPKAVPEPAAQERRRELAALAWPEAAGTTPEQREALELAVRHRLPADELAIVLGMDPDAARVLLSTAVAEVERTRAALAVVDQHGCPAIARLAGDRRLFLSAALSRELVRHVDDCADCRRAAERAGAGWAWPGTLRAARPDGPLPVLPAPRAAAHAAMLHAQRTRFAHPPRFDRRGYPRDPRHRAARRGRLRSRVVTSTAVATVIAAPVLALWAANRDAPATGEAQSGWPPPSAGAGDPESLAGRPVEKAGSAHDGPSPGPPSDHRGNRPDVSVEVMDHGGRAAGRPEVGPGRLTVEAWPSGEITYLRLRASGGTAVDWRLGTDAPWLRFSATYGTLRPGESTTVAVAVAKAGEPRGGWQARVYVSPGETAILISGSGSGRTGTGPGSPDPSRPPSDPPDPSPSDPDPSPSDPDPSPSDPDPSPSDPDPSPSDPDPSPSDPDPSPSDPDPTPTASDGSASPPASSPPPPAQAPSPTG